jgi:hypothetical protein
VGGPVPVSLALVNEIGRIVKNYVPLSLPAREFRCTVFAVWARAGFEQTGEIEDGEVDVDTSGRQLC